jgi:hypothetical protein
LTELGAACLARPWVVPGLLLALGVVLRVVQFLPDRSLHHDEAALGVNLTQRSFAGLLERLDFEQGAPIGFLMLQKIVALLVGGTDWSLRLLPFLCSLASLYVFWQVAQLHVERRAALLALGLFAIGRGLVYYSSELKQYSSDVLIALVLWWLAARVSLPCRPGRLLAWGLAGAAAVWFSHASVFVLAGTGTCFAWACLRGRHWRGLAWFGAVLSLWLVSFGTGYLLFLKELGTSAYLLQFWKTSFMPLPPRSVADLNWFPQTFFAVLEMPGGLVAQGVSGAILGVLALLIGGLALWREKPLALAALLSPVGFTLLASGLHKYPFGDRLVLFLVPGVLLVIAAGAAEIWQRLAPAWPQLGAAIVGLLVFCPLLAAAGKAIDPGRDDQIKPMLQYLKDQRQEGELIYVYASSWPAYLFYADQYGLPKTGGVQRGTLGRTFATYAQDVDGLARQGRVWLLFSHHQNAQRAFLGQMDRSGVKLAGRSAPGAAVYLYAFD